MKSMQPPLVAIFFMTYFGSATGQTENITEVFIYFVVNIIFTNTDTAFKCCFA